MKLPDKERDIADARTDAEVKRYYALRYRRSAVILAITGLGLFGFRLVGVAGLAVILVGAAVAALLAWWLAR